MSKKQNKSFSNMWKEEVYKELNKINPNISEEEKINEFRSIKCMLCSIIIVAIIVGLIIL